MMRNVRVTVQDESLSSALKIGPWDVTEALSTDFLRLISFNVGYGTEGPMAEWQVWQADDNEELTTDGLIRAILQDLRAILAVSPRQDGLTKLRGLTIEIVNDPEVKWWR